MAIIYQSKGNGFLLFLALICTTMIRAQQIQYINSETHNERDYPFSEATVVNDIVYLSGQIGTDENDRLVSGGIAAETQQALKNIENVLIRMGLSKAYIFKCTCMLENIGDWPAMSKAYKSFFAPNKLPARSAFAGSGLALGAKVEIECMASMH
ncbi:MAG: RidA family protein [Flavobacteriaceae bacterium]